MTRSTTIGVAAQESRQSGVTVESATRVDGRWGRRRLVLALAGVAMLGTACSGGGYVAVPPSSSPSGVPGGAGTSAAAPAPVADDGTFASVPIGAGGFVTGISISDDGATRLVRTDGFGGYRWADDRWQLDVSTETLPAEDASPDLPGGVLAVEVAPSDASIAYLAYNDAVYRSDDAAQSWVKVLDDVVTPTNDSFRLWGDRLAIDPIDPDVVVYGSQLDGLTITRDGGATWTPVDPSAVPVGDLVDLADPEAGSGISRPTVKTDDGRKLAGAGVSSVAFDRSGPTADGATSVLYAASYGTGIYRSEDAGASWSLISPPEIQAVSYLRVTSDGTVLAIARPDVKAPGDDSSVWRWRDGDWTDVTPSVGGRSKKWNGLAVDPTTPGRIAVTAIGGQSAISTDSGGTWQITTRTQSSTGDVPWLSWALNEGDNFMTPGELLFDPVDSGRLWLTEGTGVWYADLGEGAPREVTWNSQARGIEQLVPNDVIVPPGGKPLLASWDRPIFRSEDLTTYPSTYGPVNAFGSAWSLDWSGADPSYVVASVANHQAPNDPTTSGFSTDGGQSWTPFPTLPLDSTDAVRTFGFGAVAVGEPGNVVWAPSYGERPYVTQDGGESWTPITLPGVSDYSVINNKPYYVRRRVIVADKAAPGTFYLYVRTVGTFRSTDGGTSWEQTSDGSAMRGDYGWNVRMGTVPGREGELYITPGLVGGGSPEPGSDGAVGNASSSAPLLHSTDGGVTWSEVPGLTGVSAFGFGAPLEGSDSPTMFAAGYLDGVYGIYRSPDDAQTWTLVTTYPAGRPTRVFAIDGDKEVPGRVYVALGGSSLVYGGAP